MSEIGNFLVKKSNDLMVARYSMTVNEQRLMLACISQIPMDTTITSEFEFVLTTEQAQELFYTENGKHNIYRDMKEAVSALWHREVKIPLDNGDVLQTRFVSSIVWAADKNTIRVNFAPKILPYLTLLKGNFTRYRMNNVVQLTSFYAVRIYELLVTWSQNGKVTQKEIEIDELKQILDIEENYKQIGDLKKRVIDIAISQINENTDFNVSVEFKKQKRAFRWIKFKFEQKADVQAAEQAKRTERKAIADQNRAAKIKREYVEQKAAEQQRAINEQLAREQAEQERQAQEKAEREQKKSQLIEIWEILSETERHEVKNHAVKNTYPAFQNSLSLAFESNNYKELTGRFFNDFNQALEPFKSQKVTGKMSEPEMSELQKELEEEQRELHKMQILEEVKDEIDMINMANMGAYESLPMEEVPQITLAEKLTQMWKAGLLSQEDFLELISKS